VVLAVLTLSEGRVSSELWGIAVIPAGLLFGLGPLVSRQWVVEALLNLVGFTGTLTFAILGPELLATAGVKVDYVSTGFGGVSYVLGLMLYLGGTALSLLIRGVGRVVG
jgi:hypothetical protein